MGSLKISRSLVVSQGTPIVFVLRVSWLRFILHVHEILYIWRSPGSLAVCARARTGFSVSLKLNSDAFFFRRGNQFELPISAGRKSSKTNPMRFIRNVLVAATPADKAKFTDYRLVVFVFLGSGEAYRT